MAAPPGTSRGAVYERVLQLCPPYLFPPPWDFLTADQDCRGPIRDTSAILSDLQVRFSEAELEEAGVLARAPSGELQIAPALCNPVGGVVALRRSPGEAPFTLLTARGCLGSDALPVVAALEDAGTAARLAETEVLYAAFRISDVVLLRAIGLPATLATGLHNASLPQLHALDEAFAAPDPFARANPPLPAPPSGETDDECLGESADPAAQPVTAGGDAPQAAPPPRPGLALVGWAPGSVGAEIPPPLRRTAGQLALVRQHLGLRLAGISLWRPPPRDMDNLRFRLNYREAESISELLRESAQVLGDFECLADPQGPEDVRPAASADLSAAQVELLARLADDRGQGRITDRVRAARHAYEELIERRLIAPLQTWALAHDNPVIRNVGFDLATGCRELHRMGPLLHEPLGRRRDEVLAGDNEAGTGRVLTEYLQLSRRLTSIVRDLQRWKESA
jgi:hypothetical protein